MKKTLVLFLMVALVGFVGCKEKVVQKATKDSKSICKKLQLDAIKTCYMRSGLKDFCFIYKRKLDTHKCKPVPAAMTRKHHKQCSDTLPGLVAQNCLVRNELGLTCQRNSKDFLTSCVPQALCVDATRKAAKACGPNMESRKKCFISMTHFRTHCRPYRPPTTSDYKKLSNR